MLAGAEPPLQLWLDVDRPIQPRPQSGGAHRRRNEAPAAAAPVQIEMSMRRASGQAAEPVRLPELVRPPLILDDVVRPPFGEWLVDQARRPGTLGELAKAAKADRLFPRNGSADDVRVRFSLAGAEGDAFEALDDAEREYERSTG